MIILLKEREDDMKKKVQFAHSQQCVWAEKTQDAAAPSWGRRVKNPVIDYRAFFFIHTDVP